MAPPVSVQCALDWIHSNPLWHYGHHGKCPLGVDRAEENFTLLRTPPASEPTTEKSDPSCQIQLATITDKTPIATWSRDAALGGLLGLIISTFVFAYLIVTVICTSFLRLVMPGENENNDSNFVLRIKNSLHLNASALPSCKAGHHEFHRPANWKGYESCCWCTTQISICKHCSWRMCGNPYCYGRNGILDIVKCLCGFLELILHDTAEIGCYLSHIDYICMEGSEMTKHTYIDCDEGHLIVIWWQIADGQNSPLLDWILWTLSYTVSAFFRVRQRVSRHLCTA